MTNMAGSRATQSPLSKSWQRDPAALDGPLTTWIPRVFFLLLPLYALLLHCSMCGSASSFISWTTSFFRLRSTVSSFAMLIVAVAAAQILVGRPRCTLIFLADGRLYLLLALKRFYRQGWFITAVKFACISFIYTVVFLVPALISVLVTGILEG